MDARTHARMHTLREVGDFFTTAPAAAAGHEEGGLKKAVMSRAAGFAGFALPLPISCCCCCPSPPWRERPWGVVKWVCVHPRNDRFAHRQLSGTFSCSLLEEWPWWPATSDCLAL